MLALARKFYGGKDGARKFLAAAREFFEQVRSYTPERNHFTIDKSAIQRAKSASDAAFKCIPYAEGADVDAPAYPALTHVKARLGALGSYDTSLSADAEGIKVSFYTATEKAIAEKKVRSTDENMDRTLENVSSALIVEINFDGSVSVHSPKTVVLSVYRGVRCLGSGSYPDHRFLIFNHIGSHSLTGRLTDWRVQGDYANRNAQ